MRKDKMDRFIIKIYLVRSSRTRINKHIQLFPDDNVNCALQESYCSDS
jgi:hypothetical protein